jgi:hypothetical protein
MQFFNVQLQEAFHPVCRWNAPFQLLHSGSGMHTLVTVVIHKSLEKSLTPKLFLEKSPDAF